MTRKGFKGSLEDYLHLISLSIPGITILFFCIMLVPAASAEDCNIIQLTNAFSEGKCLYPSWSPDGERIAYQGNSSLWIMDSDGSNKTCLPTGSSIVHPGWSPAGGQIAFSQSDGEELDVWTIRSDGTGAICLTNAPYDDFFISWSPDGTKIAFFSNRSGSRELWAMEADGSNQHRVFDGEVWNSPEDLYDGEISWSPDGDRIALASLIENKFDIWICDGSLCHLFIGFERMRPTTKYIQES